SSMLVGLQIADGAGVSFDEFSKHFLDPEECYRTAFQEIAAPLLDLAHAGPPSETWVHHAHQVSERLLWHLAENPLHAEAIITPSCALDDSVKGLGRDLVGELAVGLTAHAPEIPDRQATVDGIAGAIWGLIYQLVQQGRPHLLAALSDHLSYLVLAPFVGPQSAIELIAHVPD
ncbi:MAG: hypothetical protein ACRDK2_15850, partial [Solirubrobacteraceae bacterium]